MHCGTQARAALLWSPEGHRARARGRLEPWVASPAAAGTTGLAMRADLPECNRLAVAHGHPTRGAAARRHEDA